MPSSRTCTDRSTWIERWPAAVARLSVPQTSVQLTPDVVHALGRRNGIGLPAFAALDKDTIANHLQPLAADIDRALDLLARRSGSRGAFVRLGSRSPKDAPRFVLTGGRATCGDDALALLTGGSRRMAHDLRWCLQQGWQPQVHLRSWQPHWETLDEWRGTLVDGRLVALCPALHAAVLDTHRVDALLREGAAALLALAQRLAAAWGNAPVVFDAWWRAGAAPVLIELNPFAPATDAGLFSPQRNDLDGSLRLRAGQGVQRWPLAQFQPGTVSAVPATTSAA